MDSGMIAAGVIIVIVIIGAFLLFGTGSHTAAPNQTTSQAYNTSSTGSTAVTSVAGQSSKQVPVIMTDPPQVPSGTSALVVAYSSVKVHTTGAQGSGWVNAKGNGTVDLMSITNSSTVIGNANVSQGATIDAAQFYINSAYIVVNGTRYNVTVPGQTVTANVTSSAQANQSSQVIVDMTPTVAAVFNNNATTFVMAPSAKGTLVAASNASLQVGSSVSLSADAQASLQASAPNITITSANISVSGNVTTVTVNVNDNSGSAVTLNNVLVYGQQQTSTSHPLNASGSSGLGVGIGSNLSIGLNASAALKVGEQIQAFQQIALVASGSGSLSQVLGAGSFSNSGVTVSPGSNATLTYSSQLTYDSGLYQTRVVAGSPYRVVVTGNAGASASTEVTAT